MTREEAIAILRQDREGICTDIQCTMTMYRDYSGVDKCNQDCEEREAYDMAIEALQAEPVKHGEWEQHDGCVLCKDDDTYFYTCSFCKMAITEAERGLFNYCPNCGADMRGDEE